jgi:predicted metal-dependent hydrolase
MAARPKEDRTWRVGSQIMFRGNSVVIHQDDNGVLFADQSIKVRLEQGQVDLRPIIEHRLRTLATRELPPRVLQLAQQHGATVQQVTVRNQKTRWGSCSPRGTISLNWRLIQTPPLVSDYIILHELMHLRQMNHSRKFWREVESVCPEFRDAERWLKSHRELMK